MITNTNYRIFLDVYSIDDLNYLKKRIDGNAIDILLENSGLIFLGITDKSQMDDDERKYLEDDKDGDLECMLIQRPFAIHYKGCGNTDIKDKLLIQNPITKSGVYSLDTSSNNKKFNLIQPDYCDWFVASDKVAPYFYTFIGDPEELFKEFIQKGYEFKKEDN